MSLCLTFGAEYRVFLHVLCEHDEDKEKEKKRTHTPLITQTNRVEAIENRWKAVSQQR